MTGKLKPSGTEGWPVQGAVRPPCLSWLSLLWEGQDKRGREGGEVIGQVIWDLDWLEDATNCSPREGLFWPGPQRWWLGGEVTVSHLESHTVWPGRHCYPHFIGAQAEA